MAEDPRLGRTVALELLARTLSADADRLRSFEQEVRAASALSHPNGRVVYDVWESAERRPLGADVGLVRMVRVLSRNARAYVRRQRAWRRPLPHPGRWTRTAPIAVPAIAPDEGEGAARDHRRPKCRARG